MSGASILMIIVLAAALVVGMVFLVGELNHSAEEILTDRQTIQELQSQLEQARVSEARQQQAIDNLNAELARTTADLDQARQALQAAQADSAGLHQSLQTEQATRAGFEQLAASLSDQLQAAQHHAALLAAHVNTLTAENTRLQQAAAQPSVHPQIPVTGPTSSSVLPLAASAAGLAVAAGGITLARRIRR